jgi:hypothetical protein
LRNKSNKHGAFSHLFSKPDAVSGSLLLEYKMPKRR